jgi:NAD(P)-dependent dehydrogenase (short-subunit alcohol dehydrogenase family)
MQLEDKVVIVTGSTTGIGEAIARRVVLEGGKVMIHGRDKTRGTQIVSELGAGRAALHVDDIADPAAAERLVAATLKAFGRINGLVNNAALIKRSNLQNTTVELFDALIATNVRAPLFLIKAAYPHLKATTGSVLNIGSVNGLCGENELLAYSISKGALITLSRNLADAFGGKVRVNHFNVGWVLTPNEYQYKIADGLPADWPERLGPPLAPNGRLIKPEEIAAAAVFWLSDESRIFSGSVLEVEQYPVIGRNPTRVMED